MLWGQLTPAILLSRGKKPFLATFYSACLMRFTARPVLFLAIFVVFSSSHFFNSLQRLYCQFTVNFGRRARGFNGAFLEGAWDEIIRVVSPR
jgi:hypothetical protein